MVMAQSKFRSIQAARILRKRMTPTEKSIWKYLSNRGFCKFKFRRQYPIRGFILDFFCPERKLGIEIDGPIHDKRKAYDRAREEIINDLGINILRFKNKDIEKDLMSVLRQIKRYVIPSPHSGEGCPSLPRTG